MIKAPAGWPMDRPPKESDEELADPYRAVRQLRWRAGYFGRDCGQCPGKVACVEMYDNLCGVLPGRGIAEPRTTARGYLARLLLALPLPCGQLAFSAEEMEGVALRFAVFLDKMRALLDAQADEGDEARGGGADFGEDVL